MGILSHQWTSGEVTATGFASSVEHCSIGAQFDLSHRPDDDGALAAIHGDGHGGARPVYATRESYLPEGQLIDDATDPLLFEGSTSKLQHGRSFRLNATLFWPEDARPRMSDAGGPEELVDRVASLEEQLDDLHGELKRHERARATRGSATRDVLRATDEHAIPALIAILEAHIHVLRLLQRTIRLLAPPSTTSTAERIRSNAIRGVVRSLTEQLDELVADLDDVPEGADAGSLEPLVEEARAIRADLAALTAHGTAMTSDGSEPCVDESTQPAEGDPADEQTRIDIEAELRSIKSEFSEDDEVDEYEERGHDGDDDQPDPD